jgi:hypothetical protein
MKPIEKMAKAYVDDGDHYISDAPRLTWIDLKHDQKREVCKGIRRALLALAEADLPVAAEGRELSIMDHAVFRAMLRTISVDEA